MMLKRAFDFVMSLIGMVVLTPLFAFLALLIKLDSPGPVFFRQERVGQHGRVFRIHKFRTMRDESEADRPQITVAGDARVTGVGRFLRRYKIDELPQVIDVVLGRMSLVGARPEVPRYVAFYPERSRTKILAFKPGITDRAAIEFRDENELLARARDPEAEYVNNILPAKIRLYEAYTAEQSFWLDLRLIFRTLAVLVARGDRQRVTAADTTHIAAAEAVGTREGIDR